MIAQKHFLAAFAIAAALTTTANADFDATPYCALVRNDFRLANLDDCQTYFVCQNGKALKQTCPSGQAYEKNSQTCMPETSVKCFNGVENPCMKVDGKGFAPVPRDCTKYIYCENGVAKGEGHCPNGQHFEGGKCSHGTSCVGETEEESFNNPCQIMPNAKFFGSTEKCEIWRYCLNNEITKGECKDGMVFDVENEQCAYNSGNMCSRVTGQEVGPSPGPSEECTSKKQGDKASDPVNCFVYYVCDGKSWTRFECEGNFYYSEAAKQCKPRQSATPNKSCDRCKYSKQSFVNAVDPECRAYYYCQNGKKQSGGDCNSGEYFNESSQACLPDSHDGATYARDNGACAANAVPSNCATKCQKVQSKANCGKIAEDCVCTWDEVKSRCQIQTSNCSKSCDSYTDKATCEACATSCKWNDSTPTKTSNCVPVPPFVE